MMPFHMQTKRLDHGSSMRVGSHQDTVRDGTTKHSRAECCSSLDPTAEGSRPSIDLGSVSSTTSVLWPALSARPNEQKSLSLHTADTTPHPIQSSSRARDGVPRLSPSGLCSAIDSFCIIPHTCFQSAYCCQLGGQRTLYYECQE